MSFVKPLLTLRHAFGCLGIILLALLIWFIGPLLGFGDAHPLEETWARLIVILVILAACLIWLGWTLMRARRREATLVAGITAGGGDSTDAGREDASALKAQLQEAVQFLRQSDGKSKRGSAFLYELPWYIMIGPPGSGKSTALENSSLVRKVGRGRRPAVRGVGGTRNCEWLFTEQAVLLDTAGRYTTQDSSHDVDSAGWLSFLDLLKRTRPRQPVNGILVAISIPEIAMGNDAARTHHAELVRARLQELHARLGSKIPVYVIFTKTDLIEGFREFFDDLEKVDREQVWGATLPLPEPGQAPDLSQVGREFDLLVEQLHGRRIDRLQQEPDQNKRALILAFPTQMASLRDPVARFLLETFETSRYEYQPQLRGFYFTSGTQEGTPIDRLTAGIGQLLGRAPVPTQASVSGRSFFVTRLLRDLIFQEAGLGGQDPRVLRRERLIRRAGLATALLVSILFMVGWGVSYVQNQARIDRSLAAADLYAAELSNIPPPSAGNPGLAAIAPALDQLRSQARAIDGAGFGGLGLSQREKLAAAADETYSRALNALLLPRILLRLEGQLRQNAANRAYAYEALKVYLMLAGHGPMDRGLVRDWMGLDLMALYPAPADDPIRQDILAHLDALIAQPIRTAEPDRALVAQIRGLLAQMSAAERGYNILQQLPQVRTLAPFRVIDAAGPAASRVLTLTSGKPLSAGVPGLFTKAGYTDVVDSAIDAVSTDLAKENWVVGGAAPQAGDGLRHDIRQLYLNDYVRAWDGLLADIALVPMTSPAMVQQVAADLSGSTSPLRALYGAVAEQTRLAPPSPTGAANQIAKATGNATLNRLGAVASQVAAIDPAPEQWVNDHFAPLHAFVTGTGAIPGASLEDTLRNLNEFYTQLATGGAALATQAGPGSAARSLQANAGRLPPSVAGVVERLVRAGSAAASGDLRSQLNQIWSSSVLPACKMITDGRYPVVRESRDETPLIDFARLFAPAGLIDGFFTANLKPYVDMGQRPWRWRSPDGVALGIPAAALLQFERAAMIRDAFFPMGASPQVRFDLAPSRLAGIGKAVLEIDGQAVTNDGLKNLPQRLQWPGPGVGQARLTVEPAAGPLTYDGAWALFRLLDAARLAGSGDRVLLTVAVGGGTAEFELRPSSIIHPFRLPELSLFRCPMGL